MFVCREEKLVCVCLGRRREANFRRNMCPACLRRRILSKCNLAPL